MIFTRKGNCANKSWMHEPKLHMTNAKAMTIIEVRPIMLKCVSKRSVI
jgi:hypothetical protein